MKIFPRIGAIGRRLSRSWREYLYGEGTLLLRTMDHKEANGDVPTAESLDAMNRWELLDDLRRRVARKRLASISGWALVLCTVVLLLAAWLPESKTAVTMTWDAQWVAFSPSEALPLFPELCARSVELESRGGRLAI